MKETYFKNIVKISFVEAKPLQMQTNANKCKQKQNTPPPPVERIHLA